MRIVFAGTPEFAVPALKALIDAGHDVVAVYTQPDKPAGRGRRLTKSPVKLYAAECAIEIHQPSTLKAPSEIGRLTSLTPDVMVVVAYGLLLPKEILRIPTHGCLNIHASILPRWRGAAPIQRAIEFGDQKTGITIMQMDEGLDTGNILLVKETPIADADTAATLHDRLSGLGGEAITEVLRQIENNETRPLPQDPKLANYAQKLTKNEAVIDWSQPANLLHRKIRAFNPWPVASTVYRGKQVRIWAVGAITSASDHLPPNTLPGTIVALEKSGIVVKTGEGLLTLTKLQIEGGRAIDAQSFINGQRLAINERFGPRAPETDAH
ncbi:MAG: methionyl-tRNA formyltransferase [Gammaproteobacteria bacterium]|nr:methionyl-tRNA formyltransferase [Gammaproteobacteria bacterium]